MPYLNCNTMDIVVNEIRNETIGASFHLDSLSITGNTAQTTLAKSKCGLMIKKEGSSLIWAFHKIVHIWLHFFFWGNPSWPVNKGFLRQLRHIGKPVQRFQISRERHSQSGRHLRSMIRLAIHVYHLGLSVHRSPGFHDNAGANILTVRIGCFTSDPISRPHTKNGNKYRAIPGTAVRLLFIPKKYKSQKVRWFF